MASTRTKITITIKAEADNESSESSWGYDEITEHTLRDAIRVFGLNATSYWFPDRRPFKERIESLCRRVEGTHAMQQIQREAGEG
jgi:hypothetical protein